MNRILSLLLLSLLLVSCGGGGNGPRVGDVNPDDGFIQRQLLVSAYRPMRAVAVLPHKSSSVI